MKPLRVSAQGVESDVFRTVVGVAMRPRVAMRKQGAKRRVWIGVGLSIFVAVVAIGVGVLWRNSKI
jgi:hypothetical protein